MDSLGKLLTVAEAAELLRVPKSWIYQRTRKRGVERLPHVKLGKYVLIEEQALWEYVERHRVGVSRVP